MVLSQKKRNTIIRITISFFVICFSIFSIYAHRASLENQAPERKEPVTLLFVGDMMADRGVRRKVERYYDGDYTVLFKNIPQIAEADISFGNLEGPIADPSIGRLRGSRFSFRMDPLFSDALRDAGFDVLSFANNHVGDYGESAVKETLRILEEKTIQVVGAGYTKAEAEDVVVFEKNGVRIGFLAFSDVGPEWMEATETRAGQLIYRKKQAESLVRQADAKVDILFVSLHWGNEYSPSHKKQSEIAYGLIDAGADGIVGHHPHVIQKIEWYKEKPVIYSLGNFIFDQYFSLHTMRGMVVRITIDPSTKHMILDPFMTTLSDHFIPGALTHFNEVDLLKKSFVPK